jgi:hypothetical protein
MKDEAEQLAAGLAHRPVLVNRKHAALPRARAEFANGDLRRKATAAI